MPRIPIPAVSCLHPLETSAIIIRNTTLHFHLQFLDFARQGIAAPAKEPGGILATTHRLLQGGLDEDALHGWQGQIQQTAGTARSEMVARPAS